MNTNKRKQSSLLHFFSHKKVISETDEVVQNPDADTLQTCITHQPKLIKNDQSEVSEFKFDNDIGNFIGKTIDDYTKLNLLKNPWKPPENFKYPFSVHNKQGKEEKRFLRPNHFEQYPWLIYSTSKSGCYCKYCTLFLTHNYGGKQKTEPLKKLVTLPLNQYSKLLGKLGDLEVHNNNHYHQDAILKSDDFLKTFNTPNKQVINIINNERLKQVHENRNRLKPIIETIIFLGRQNIPFRGHRDSGQLSCREADSFKHPEYCVTMNEGNFRELLKYRVLSGDKNLENHLLSKNCKATYISPIIQEYLIKCCKEEILQYILDEVKENVYYSVIFDETTDITHTSQMSLFLRYIDAKKNIHERFVAFINCHVSIYINQNEIVSNENLLEKDTSNLDDISMEPKLTGEKLGNIVVTAMKEMSLNLMNCVGISTDGCSVMTSVLKGAVQQVQKFCPNAVYSPCTNHALNLSISKSSNIQMVRNNVGVYQETISFFNLSSKRSFVLKNNLKGCKRSITNFCETRWKERHTSILEFQTNLQEIVKSLTSISEWTDQSSSSKANSLLSVLCSCESIVTLYTLSNILSITLPGSKILQGVSQDVGAASNYIKNIITTLEDKRLNAEECFSETFHEAKITMDDLDVEIKLPRIIKTQTKRNNTPSSSPEEYYRRVLYIPLIDNILEDLKTRFLNEKTTAIFHLMQLIPRIIINISTQKKHELINKIIEHYSFLEINEAILKGEVELWRSTWISNKNKDGKVPGDIMISIDECHPVMFPTIRQILLLLATLPVSTASAERSFSTLRRLKTWLRNQMTQQRLTSLALMNIHRDISIDVDKVINRFSKSKRKIDFVI